MCIGARLLAAKHALMLMPKAPMHLHHACALMERQDRACRPGHAYAGHLISFCPVARWELMQLCDRGGIGIYGRRARFREGAIIAAFS